MKTPLEASDSECSPLDVACKAKNRIGDVVGDVGGAVAGNAIDKFATAVSEAVGETIKALATSWTDVDSVNLSQSASVDAIQNSLWWYMGAVAVLAVIVAGAKMAMEMRAQPLRDLFRSLGTLVLVTSAGVITVSLFVQGGDQFSSWMIAESGGEGFNKRMTKLLGGVGSSGGLGALLVIVIGLMTVIAGLVQMALMVFRDAILIVLVGVWPLSAAAINTTSGRQWFTRITGWIVAFVLFKPAAAIIYGAAFTMFGNEKGLRGALVGCAMMLMAVFALPALMRLAVPMVGAMGGGGGGAGGALAGVAAAGAMSGGGRGPSGAMPMPALSGGGSMASSPSGSASSGGGSLMSGGGGGGGGASSGMKPAAMGGGAGGGAAGGAAAGGGAAAAGPAGAIAAAADTVKGTAAAMKQQIQDVASEGESGPSGSQ